MKNGEIRSWPELSQPFFSLSNSLWALIPLEAWRRGLQVTLRPDAHYTISDGLTEHAFWQTRLTGAVQDRVARATDDKNATRDMLLEAGIPSPQGRSFQGEVDLTEVQDYAETLGYPVCLKPNAWAKGRGVYPRLENREALAEALQTLVSALGCDDLVLEQHVRGDALRVFVADGKVVAATRAEPANVVGDGTSTIRELVEAKSEARRTNPHLRNHALVLDSISEQVLADAGLTPESVPSVDRTVYLREAANLAQGGDSWDVTDALPAPIAQVAIDAARATPGLDHAGVDLLVEDYSRPDSAVFVNELNPSAGLGGHIYPAQGTSRDVPSAIIDHYFPGSARIAGSHNWYFPLNQVNRFLASRAATSVDVSPMPTLAAPSWTVLRVKAEAIALPRLRNTVIGKLNRTEVHGQVERIGGDHFDVYLAGDGASVNAASRAVRRVAESVKGTARVASRAAFPTAVGMRPM